MKQHSAEPQLIYPMSDLTPNSLIAFEKRWDKGRTERGWLNRIRPLGNFTTYLASEFTKGRGFFETPPDGFKWHDLIQLLIDNKCQIYSFEDHRELMKWLAELPQ